MKPENMPPYMDRILEKLQNVDIKKIILFGSWAAGSVDNGSDIDLLIVLDNNTLPQSFEERLNLQVPIRKLLRDINLEIPLDLLVYTAPEYEILREHMGSFFREIHHTGKLIYEKAS